MKKLLLLLVPLLFLVGCSSSGGSAPAEREIFQPVATATRAPAWDTVKYVEYICSRSGNTLRGQQALDLCPASRIKVTVGILTPQGTIYELEVPASDYSSGSPNIRGSQLIGLLPEVGDLWTGQPELKAPTPVSLTPAPVVTITAKETPTPLSKLPADSPRPEFHTVVTGDGLNSWAKIAQFYSVTEQALRAANPRWGNESTLWVGTELEIPPIGTVAVATPTVEATVILPFRAWGQGIAPGREIDVLVGSRYCERTYADSSGNWYVELKNGCSPNFKYAPDLKVGDWLKFTVTWIDSTIKRLQGTVRYEPGANVEVIMRDVGQ